MIFKLTFSLSGLFFFFLFRSNYVDEKIFIIYNIILFSILIFYYNKAILMTLQAPVTFLPFIIAFINFYDLRVVMSIWILTNLLLFYKRFIKVIKEYIEGIPQHNIKEDANYYKNKSKR